MSVSKKHQEILKKKIEELNKKGYKAVSLGKPKPDGVAVKDNKLYAVEVLRFSSSHTPNSKAEKRFIKEKKKVYKMYDGVIIEAFRLDKDNPNKIRKARPRVYGPYFR